VERPGSLFPISRWLQVQNCSSEVSFPLVLILSRKGFLFPISSACSSSITFMVRHILTFHLATADITSFTTVGGQKAVGLHDTVFIVFGFEFLEGGSF